MFSDVFFYCQKVLSGIKVRIGPPYPLLDVMNLSEAILRMRLHAKTKVPCHSRGMARYRPLPAKGPEVPNTGLDNSLVIGNDDVNL